MGGKRGLGARLSTPTSKEGYNMPIIIGFRYRPPLSSLMPTLKPRVTILPKIFFLAASKIGLKFFTWYHETQFLTKFALFWAI